MKSQGLLGLWEKEFYEVLDVLWPIEEHFKKTGASVGRILSPTQVTQVWLPAKTIFRLFFHHSGFIYYLYYVFIAKAILIYAKIQQVGATQSAKEREGKNKWAVFGERNDWTLCLGTGIGLSSWKDKCLVELHNCSYGVHLPRQEMSSGVFLGHVTFRAKILATFLCITSDTMTSPTTKWVA